MSAGDGRYTRDATGTWRYTATGEPVPGASDMTPSNLYNFRCQRVGDITYVEVPRAMAAREPELRWVLAFAPRLPDDVADLASPRDPDTGRAVVRVPMADWDAHDHVIGMWAPELAPAAKRAP